MDIKGLLKVLEEIAPLEYSKIFCEKFDAYDNSGIIIDNNSEVTGVVFALDLTSEVVDKAIDMQANVIVTHHPAIYKPIKEISFSEPIYKAIQNKIGVISMHLNLDSAPNGIDYHLAKGIGGDNLEILYPIKNGGYGRIFSLNKTSLAKILQVINKNFSTNKVLVYGKDEEKSYKVLSLCGAGLSEKELYGEYDLIISSDIPHHLLLKGLELNKKFIVITHYASEIYGFERFYKEIKNKLKVNSQIYIDSEML